MRLPIAAVRLARVLPFLALGGCMGALELAPDDSGEVLSRHLLDVPSPLEPGPYPVRSLFYGSGTDKNRPEFRDSVEIVTESVDASKLVDLGGSAKSRNDYWGFEPDSFPLNGRVWYPRAKECPRARALVLAGRSSRIGPLGRVWAAAGVREAHTPRKRMMMERRDLPDRP